MWLLSVSLFLAGVLLGTVITVAGRSFMRRCWGR